MSVSVVYEVFVGFGAVAGIAGSAGIDIALDFGDDDVCLGIAVHIGNAGEGIAVGGVDIEGYGECSLNAP